MLAQKAMTWREDQLLREMNQVRTSLQYIGGYCGQGIDGGGDVVDQANHTVEMATNLALQRLCEQRFVQLGRARARLRTGQYGVCESCGVQIDPARLDTVPYATLCVRCQQHKEQRST